MKNTRIFINLKIEKWNNVRLQHLRKKKDTRNFRSNIEISDINNSMVLQQSIIK